jgi:hypothetical protein
MEMKAIQTPRAKPHFHWTHVRDTHQIIAISIMFHFSRYHQITVACPEHSRDTGILEACFERFKIN